MERSHARRFVVLGVAAALGMSACGSAARTVAVPPHGPAATATTAPPTSAPALDQPPAPRDVAAGRYVHAAELDNGTLTVSPAPPSDRPAVDQHEARVLFGSDPTARGARQSTLLGFGLVSVENGLGISVRDTPAWLGLASGGAISCPAMTTPTGPTTTTVAPPTPGYRAVIIVGPHRVFDYRSRGSTCGFPASGPSADAASETLSLPWKLVSLQATSVSYRYQAPSCAPPGNPSASMTGNVRTGVATLSVEMTLPFDRPSCPDTWRQGSTQTALPGGPGAPPVPHYTRIDHGPTGPVGSFQG